MRFFGILQYKLDPQLHNMYYEKRQRAVAGFILMFILKGGVNEKSFNQRVG